LGGGREYQLSLSLAAGLDRAHPLAANRVSTGLTHWWVKSLGE
jgi:hypothetical protein